MRPANGRAARYFFYRGCAVEDQKATLLIIEDDLDVADMLNAYFRVQGYNVLVANFGEDGINAAQAQVPDVIILDIRLPDMDGFEIAQKLRDHRRTQSIPIIFLTERRERMDRLRGLELKAEDYITKPFDIQELRLKVRNVLRRAHQGSLTHPVTGLPEGELVQERLRQWLDDQTAGIYIVALQNLDHFREVYGFVASDDLLRAISLMLHDILRELSGADAFLGQLDLARFVVIARFESRQAFLEKTRKRLEQSFDYFYRDQDRFEGVFRENGLAVTVREFIPPAGLTLHTAEQIQAALVNL